MHTMWVIRRIAITVPLAVINHNHYNTSLPAAGRSLVGGRITNEDVKPYRKVNSLVALKFHPEVLSFDFSCVTKFILEIE